MSKLWSLIIILSIVSGQLIRIPIGLGGINLLDLTVIAFCFFGLIKSKFKLKKPPIHIKTAFLFISIAFISLILSPIHLQFSQFLISFFYIVRFSFYIFFSYLIYSETFANLQKDIGIILVYSGAGLAILGLLQLIFLPNLQFLQSFGWDPHYFRTVSTFLDPNFAGAFFTLSLILIMIKKYTKYTIAFFVTIFLALLTTFSRSSYLMLLISGLTLSFLEKSKTLLIKTTVVFLILLIGFQIYTQLISKPRNIDRGKSASFRLNTWQQGWQLFQKSPILGVGFNSYRYGIAEYNLGDKQFLESHGSSSNDSSLLFVASTTGIVGLISYLIFLFYLIKNAWRENPILISVLTGLLIHSFFANSLFYPPILLWLLLISVNPKE